MRIVLVCGSRTFNNREFVFESLDLLHSKNPIICIIEGEAPGPDVFSKEWAQSRGVLFTPFYPQWKTYGKSAGLIRNKKMLRDGKPTEVVAYVDKPLEESRGTFHMVTIAREAGIEVTVLECPRLELPVYVTPKGL